MNLPEGCKLIPLLGPLFLFGCGTLEEAEEEVIERVREGVDGLNDRAQKQLCEYTTLGGYQRMVAGKPEFKANLDGMCSTIPRSWETPPE